MVDRHDIPAVDRKGLRDFALTISVVTVALFGLLAPWLLARPFRIWPWVLAAILIPWGLIAPSSLRPLYRGWMRLGLLLNKIMSPLIMAIIFYVAITPIALLRRMLGHKLPSHRDPSAATYRVSSKRAHPFDLTRPF